MTPPSAPALANQSTPFPWQSRLVLEGARDKTRPIRAKKIPFWSRESIAISPNRFSSESPGAVISSATFPPRYLKTEASSDKTCPEDPRGLEPWSHAPTLPLKPALPPNLSPREPVKFAFRPRKGKEVQGDAGKGEGWARLGGKDGAGPLAGGHRGGRGGGKDRICCLRDQKAPPEAWLLPPKPGSLLPRRGPFPWPVPHPRSRPTPDVRYCQARLSCTTLVFRGPAPSVGSLPGSDTAGSCALMGWGHGKRDASSLVAVGPPGARLQTSPPRLEAAAPWG